MARQLQIKIEESALGARKATQTCPQCQPKRTPANVVVA